MEHVARDREKSLERILALPCRTFCRYFANDPRDSRILRYIFPRSSGIFAIPLDITFLPERLLHRTKYFAPTGSARSIYLVGIKSIFLRNLHVSFDTLNFVWLDFTILRSQNFLRVIQFRSLVSQSSPKQVEPASEHLVAHVHFNII